VRPRGGSAGRLERETQAPRAFFFPSPCENCSSALPDPRPPTLTPPTHPLFSKPQPSSSDDAASRAAAVLAALSHIQDPDLGADIVACGFVKNLKTDDGGVPGAVAFTLELTTPACPVKAVFKEQAQSFVGALPWVRSVEVTFSSRPMEVPAPGIDGDEAAANGRPGGLASVRHLLAVSSCKGGVGKSTTAVNLAYTLAQMGAAVGLLDADVYGPSLPTMVADGRLGGDGVAGLVVEGVGGETSTSSSTSTTQPPRRVLEIDPVTRAITPVSVGGVACVSFGWAGQGAAIMRGAMVSGLIEQLLTTPAWGALDYLVVDFPPGTGDIQLTLLQAARFDAAVIVTTPQRLAYVDVAKGVRMFGRLGVPAVAVAENMAFFDAPDTGKRYFPFGRGDSAGTRIQADFGIPHLLSFPIVPALSAAGDAGAPLVVTDPAGPVAAAFMELGAAVVTEVAKADGAAGRARLEYEPEANALLYWPRGSSSNEGGSPLPHRLRPAAVRRADASARAVDEWTGAPADPPPVPDDLTVSSLQPVGAYAAQVTWGDGASSLATWEQLDDLVARVAGGEGGILAAEEGERAVAGAV
jgi:Mrp family chromosome partitioning ATPase